MRKIILIIYLILISIKTYAQDKLPVNKYKPVISTSLLEYIPLPYNMGNFNLGSDIYLGNHFSIYANLGFIKAYGPAQGDWLLRIYAEDVTGGKIQIEGRKYFNCHELIQPLILLFWPHIFQFNSRKLLNSGYYMAAGVTYEYLIIDRKETVAYYNNPNPVPYKIEDKIYNIHKSNFCPNLKLGYQAVKNDNVVVDFSFGMGIQFIKSFTKNKLTPENPWHNNTFENGKIVEWMPNFKFRIGWSFGSRE